MRGISRLTIAGGGTQNDTLEVELYTYGGKQITVNLEAFQNFCAGLEWGLADLREAKLKLLFLRQYLTGYSASMEAKTAGETVSILLSRLEISTGRFAALITKLKTALGRYQEAENNTENNICNGLSWVSELFWQGISDSTMTWANYALGILNGTETPATNLALISFLLAEGLNRKDYDLQVTPIIGTKNTGQAAPLNSAELLRHYQPVYPQDPREGMLRVSEYRNKTGGRSWLVEMPGTQNWGINTSSPHDLSTNFRTNAGLASDLNVAVTQALQQAGYHEGEPLELVGHSQGAAVATALAANRNFTKKHNVVSVLATGGNIGAVKPLGNAHILAFERNTDVVPWLDGRSNAKVANLTTVVGKINKIEGVKATHSRSRYLLLAQTAEKEKLYEVKKWDDYRLVKLGIDENTEMVSRDYQILRKYRSQN